MNLDPETDLLRFREMLVQAGVTPAEQPADEPAPEQGEPAAEPGE